MNQLQTSSPSPGVSLSDQRGCPKHATIRQMLSHVRDGLLVIGHWGNTGSLGGSWDSDVDTSEVRVGDFLQLAYM